MSSPIAINRPVSPAESSHSGASSYTSLSSMSSTASQALTYTREELLTLAASPLAQTRAPPTLQAFPQILRKTRRGVLEAFQALEYSRTTSPPTTVNDSDSPRQANTNSSQLPMWKTDVYIPPARRAQTPIEQRMRAVRDMKARPARRTGPVQARW